MINRDFYSSLYIHDSNDLFIFSKCVQINGSNWSVMRFVFFPFVSILCHSSHSVWITPLSASIHLYVLNWFTMFTDTEQSGKIQTISMVFTNHSYWLYACVRNMFRIFIQWRQWQPFNKYGFIFKSNSLRSTKHTRQIKNHRYRIKVGNTLMAKN